MQVRHFWSGLEHGVRTAVRNNLSAYGFSVMITASYGAITASLGNPSVGKVFLFVAGAIVAVGGIDVISSRGFRVKFRGDTPEVVALGSAFAFVSIGFGVGAAVLGADLLGDPLGWAGGAFAASATFVLLAGVEMTLARLAQDDLRDDEQEEKVPPGRDGRARHAHGEDTEDRDGPR